MNLKFFKKISLNNMLPQGIHNFHCPECNYSFLDDDVPLNVLGYGNYPNSVRRDKVFGLAFECPNCYIKSYCHTTKDHLKGVNNLCEQLKMVK